MQSLRQITSASPLISGRKPCRTALTVSSIPVISRSAWAASLTATSRTRGTDNSMNESSSRASRVAAWPIARLATSCSASRWSSVRIGSDIQPELLEDGQYRLGRDGLGDERGGAERAHARLGHRLNIGRDDDHERVQILVL